jgi:predicted CopG family antitoxin
MAVKTITIDTDAYEALARRKRAGQSFSEVIKEHFTGSGTARDLLQAARRASLADETLVEIEDQIARRGRNRARAPRL